MRRAAELGHKEPPPPVSARRAAARWLIPLAAFTLLCSGCDAETALAGPCDGADCVGVGAMGGNATGAAGTGGGATGGAGTAGHGGAGGGACGALDDCGTDEQPECVDTSSSVEHCGGCDGSCLANIPIDADSCVNGTCMCAALGDVCPAGELCTATGCEVPYDENVWYLSCSTGSDAASGHSPAEALASIAELNERLQAEPLAGGQSVLLARGDVCRGNLVLAFDPSDAFAEPVTIGAYGYATDPRPVISGAVPVTGWTQVDEPSQGGVAIPFLAGRPIYSAAGPSGVAQLFAGDERLSLSAFNDECNADPASPSYRDMPVAIAWDFSSATTGRLRSIDTFSYPLTVPVTPGEDVLIRVNEWYWGQHVVTAIDPATRWISFSGTVAPDLRASTLDQTSQRWGFTMRNAVVFVTCPDEWAYDTSSHVLHLWSASTAPDQRNVEASVGSTTLDAGNIPAAAHLEIRHLAVARSAAHGIRLTGPGSAVVDDVLVEDVALRGLFVTGLDDFTLSNSEIRGAQGGGATISSVGSAHVHDNDVASCGALGAMAEPGQSISGIRVAAGDSFVVENNSVVDSGYAGIVLGALDGSAVIQNNYVDRHSLYLNDSGGIYVNGMNHANGATTQIEHNVVRAGVPHTRGTNAGAAWQLAAGVYLDWMASHVTVRDNALLGNASFVGAIFVHGGSDDVIEGNTSYQAGWPNIGFAYDVNGDDPSVQLVDIITRDNILYTQGAVHANVRVDGSAQAAIVAGASGNVYLNPSRDETFERVDAAGQVTFLSPSGQNNTLGYYYVTANTSATFDNVRRAFNGSFAPVTTTLDHPYCGVDGMPVSGDIVVPALSVRLLLRCYCNADGVCNNAETVAYCTDDCS